MTSRRHLDPERTVTNRTNRSDLFGRSGEIPWPAPVRPGALVHPRSLALDTAQIHRVLATPTLARPPRWGTPKPAAVVRLRGGCRGNLCRLRCTDRLGA
jgi:hypothetical protein